VSSTPTVEASGFEADPDISNVQDIALSPDGEHIIPAGGYPYEFVELEPSTLELSGTIYPAYPYPNAVDMTSANGASLQAV
jgi:hypothetical protein